MIQKKSDKYITVIVACDDRFVGGTAYIGNQKSPKGSRRMRIKRPGALSHQLENKNVMVRVTRDGMEPFKLVFPELSPSTTTVTVTPIFTPDKA